MNFKINDIDLISSALAYVYFNNEALIEYKNLLLDKKVTYPAAADYLNKLSNYILLYPDKDPLENYDFRKKLFEENLLSVVLDRIELQQENKVAFYKLLDMIKGNSDNTSNEIYLLYDSVLDAFKRFVGGNLKYLANANDKYKYAKWNGRKWVLLTLEDVKIVYGDFIKKCKTELLSYDDEDYKKLYKKLERWKKVSYEKEVFNDIARDSDFVIDMTTYEYDLGIYVTKNGKLINLNTRTIKDNTRNDLMLYSSEFNLVDKEECIEWVEKNILKAYRNILSNDKLNYLLDFIAYKLQGNRQQKALFMYGNGSTGKSLFTNICSDLFGDKVTRINKDYITIAHKGNSDSSRDDTLMSLHKKLLAMCSEFNPSDFFNPARFKKILSGSKDRSRETGEKSQDIDLSNLDLLIDTNDIPRFINVDNAFQRRIQCIEFKNRIENPNTNFYKDVVKPNFDYIFSYFIYRALDLKELIVPDEVKKETNAVISNISPINNFIQEHIISSPKDRVLVSEFLQELYKEYDKEDMEEQYGFNEIQDGKIANAKILLSLLKDNTNITNDVNYKRISVKINGITEKRYVIEGILLKTLECGAFSENELVTINKY